MELDERIQWKPCPECETAAGVAKYTCKTCGGERNKWKLPPDASAVKAYIEELANGVECKTCQHGKSLQTGMPGDIGGGTSYMAPCECVKPDPRLIDALIHITIYDTFTPDMISEALYQARAYTSDWRHGGPLLEGISSWQIISTGNHPTGLRYGVSITEHAEREDGIFLEYIFHPSELMARCSAYLFWAVMTGRLENEAR